MKLRRNSKGYYEVDFVDEHGVRKRTSLGKNKELATIKARMLIKGEYTKEKLEPSEHYTELFLKYIRQSNIRENTAKSKLTHFTKFLDWVDKVDKSVVDIDFSDAADYMSEPSGT
jgi:hypothetical protein